MFIQTFLFSPSANLNNVLCWKSIFKIAPWKVEKKGKQSDGKDEKMEKKNHADEEELKSFFIKKSPLKHESREKSTIF